MMYSNTAEKPDHLSETQQMTRDAGTFMARKVWLPKLVYNALPYFYLISGIAAFFATLYIGDWFWILPHYFLFSLACIHLGVIVYRRRHSQRPETSNREPS